MNSVPLIFLSDIVRLTGPEKYCKLSGQFGDIANPDTFHVLMHIYCGEDETVYYGLLSIKNNSDWVPYKYNPSDILSVTVFEILVCCGGYPNPDLEWTKVEPTDPQFLQWLNAPFSYVRLAVEIWQSGNIQSTFKVLEIIPENRTFNEVWADCGYKELLHGIIQKSNETRRLEMLKYPKFYRGASRKEILKLAENERLLKNGWLKDYYDSISRIDSRIERLWQFADYCQVNAVVMRRNVREYHKMTVIKCDVRQLTILLVIGLFNCLFEYVFIEMIATFCKISKCA